jgi:hypothetical protein
MFQAAYQQYVYTDENFGSYRLLSPEASTQWTPRENKCDEDAQIGKRYVTTCEKSVGVVKCAYFDMLLFQDDICVFQLAEHARSR